MNKLENLHRLVEFYRQGMHYIHGLHIVETNSQQEQIEAALLELLYPTRALRLNGRPTILPYFGGTRTYHEIERDVRDVATSNLVIGCAVNCARPVLWVRRAGKFWDYRYIQNAQSVMHLEKDKEGVWSAEFIKGRVAPKSKIVIGELEWN